MAAVHSWCPCIYVIVYGGRTLKYPRTLVFVHSYLDRDIEVGDVVEDEVHELLQPVLPDVSDEGLRARRRRERDGGGERFV